MFACLLLLQKPTYFYIHIKCPQDKTAYESVWKVRASQESNLESSDP